MPENMKSMYLGFVLYYIRLHRIGMRGIALVKHYRWQRKVKRNVLYV